MTLDVRKLRASMRLTQFEFAARFGFNISTLRQWEQGRKSPDGAARVLLMVIERSPEAVAAAAESLRPRRVEKAAAA